MKKIKSDDLKFTRKQTILVPSGSTPLSVHVSNRGHIYINQLVDTEEEDRPQNIYMFSQNEEVDAQIIGRSNYLGSIVLNDGVLPELLVCVFVDGLQPATEAS